jgi:hypothetical protein
VQDPEATQWDFQCRENDSPSAGHEAPHATSKGLDMQHMRWFGIAAAGALSMSRRL